MPGSDPSLREKVEACIEAVDAAWPHPIAGPHADDYADALLAGPLAELEADAPDAESRVVDLMHNLERSVLQAKLARSDQELAVLRDEVARLREQNERLHLAYIEATNPGIDLDEVKRTLASPQEKSK